MKYHNNVSFSYRVLPDYSAGVPIDSNDNEIEYFFSLTAAVQYAEQYSDYYQIEEAVDGRWLPLIRYNADTHSVWVLSEKWQGKNSKVVDILIIERGKEDTVLMQRSYADEDGYEFVSNRYNTMKGIETDMCDVYINKISLDPLTKEQMQIKII